MYKTHKANITSLKINKTYVGETLEQKINRIVNNKEPISDGAPLVYTDRKDGVNPAHDIKTDRWEIAVEATDVIDKSRKAKREMMNGEKTYDTMTPEQQGEFHKKFPNNKHNPTENKGEA